MRKLALLVMTGALIVGGCSRSEPPKSEAESQKPDEHAAEKAEGTPGVLRVKAEMLRDLKVTTAEVEARPGGEGSTLLGELRVNENAYAEVGAPIASRVVNVNAGIGDNVRVGEALAMLQSTDLGRSRADIITAQSRLELAKQILERKKRLSAEKIVAQKDVQEAESNVATAEADLRAARASVRAMGASADESNDSSQYSLRSPVSGTVIERFAIKGKMVGAEEVLFKVGDLSNLWLNVQAYERDAVRIKRGSEVLITLPALPGRSISGKVDLVGRSVNPESRTLTIRVVVANRDGVLRPGMSATAWVTPGDAGAATITAPAASLQRLGNDWVVFIPGKQPGEFEIRKVGRGRDLGGEIEILNGVSAREKVVVEGAFLLKAEAEKARGEGSEHDH